MSKRKQRTFYETPIWDELTATHGDPIANRVPSSVETDEHRQRVTQWLDS